MNVNLICDRPVRNDWLSTLQTVKTAFINQLKQFLIKTRVVALGLINEYRMNKPKRPDLVRSLHAS